MKTSIKPKMPCFKQKGMSVGVTVPIENYSIGPVPTMQDHLHNVKQVEAFEMNSIDVVGYSDYLEYDLRDGKAVQSWWKFSLTRKSDGKKIILPTLYSQDFDNEGKIISSNSYISTKVLDAK